MFYDTKVYISQFKTLLDPHSKKLRMIYGGCIYRKTVNADVMEIFAPSIRRKTFFQSSEKLTRSQDKHVIKANYHKLVHNIIFTA